MSWQHPKYVYSNIKQKNVMPMSLCKTYKLCMLCCTRYLSECPVVIVWHLHVYKKHFPLEHVSSTCTIRSLPKHVSSNKTYFISTANVLPMYVTECILMYVTECILLVYHSTLTCCPFPSTNKFTPNDKIQYL